MNREGLKARWEARCRDYVPEKPAGFSEDAAVFGAAPAVVPGTLAKQMGPRDAFVRLEFLKPGAERGLGTLECSPERMADLTRFLQDGDVKMAFGWDGKADADIWTVRDSAAIADRDIWFIGDLHGDLLALRSILAFANSHSDRRPVYVFLGDFFDRNPFGLNVLMDVVDLLRRVPDSVFLIAGNHDDGLGCGDDGRFFSRIQPHQFADELNELSDAGVSAFAKAFIDLVRRLPVGLLLPNGLFATHGGVPSRPERNVKNVWESLDRDAILRTIHERRTEFLNNRFQKDVATGTKIRPEFSWAEIANFGAALETAFGMPMRAMVRGHDHCDLCRHDWAFSKFAGNDACPPERAGRVRDVLTMVSMVAMDSAERKLSGFLQHQVSFPTIARYDADMPVPQVFTIAFPPEAALEYAAAAQKMSNEAHDRAWIRRKPGLQGELENIRKNLESEQNDQDFARRSLDSATKREQDAEKLLQEWERKRTDLQREKENLERKISTNEDWREDVVATINRRTQKKTNAGKEKGRRTPRNADWHRDSFGGAAQWAGEDRWAELDGLSTGPSDAQLAAQIVGIDRTLKNDRAALQKTQDEMAEADERIVQIQSAVRTCREQIDEFGKNLAECDARVRDLAAREERRLADLERCRLAEERLKGVER